jgi:O-antigen ligase
MPLLFLVFVFLLGGGSRSDIASLPLLRGAAVLFACWAITGMTRGNWRRIRTPLVLITLLILWTAIQLVPLPPETWQPMPGRETIVAIDRMLGQPDIWRPISLTPSQTWNSLLALTVPLAAVLVAARMDGDDQGEMMFAIVGIATFSALLGLFQILSGIGSAVYFYRITDPVSMVGLFANRNHHAFFLAIALLVAATLLRDELMRKRQRKIVQVGLTFAAIILTASVALIGSRAGFAAGVVAFCIGYAVVGMAWSAGQAEQDGRRRDRRSSLPLAARWKKLVLYAPPALLMLVLGVVLWLGTRTSAVARFMGEGVADDLRVRAWPTVQSMIETYWLTGSGFGSFASVYKMFEPDALLQPSYFNHAHNDWTEALLTGGLPFVLIMLATFLWLGRAILAKGAQNLIKGYRGDVRLLVLAVTGLLAAASFTDYPLRVPSVQTVSIMLLLMITYSRAGRAERQVSGRRDRERDCDSGLRA